MAYNTIWVGPADGANKKPLCIEGTAGGAIRAGALVSVVGNEITASAADGKAVVELVIAREIGEMFGKTIDDQWATGDHVIAVKPRSGEFFNVRVAAGQAIVRGSALTTDGGSGFKLAGAGDVTLAYAAGDYTSLPANSLILATI